MPKQFMSLVAVCLTAVGCSASLVEPDLYPDRFLQSKTRAEVEADVRECNVLADEYSKNPNKYSEIAKESAESAIIGSAAGALGGVVTGSNVGRSVGAGAAIGAIVPLLQRAFRANEPAPNRRRFVDYCMVDRGYRVIGQQ